MSISKVWIEPGCIVCELSTSCCPEVFEILPGADSTRVKERVDFSKYEEQIRDAASGCPVEVIKYEE